MSNPLTQVNVIQVNPLGPSITFGLQGDSTYEPAGSSASGGWQIVDRPRQVASLQWYDRSPWQLVGDAVIDSETIYGAGQTGNSVEAYCTLLESWSDKIPGTQLPPILSIAGPVPGIQRQWILYKASFGKAIRDPQAGFRVQQNVNLTFYEYNAPITTIGGLPTPAQAAQAALNAAQSSQSYTLYTASQGDTLVSIAAAQLGNWQDWLLLSALNNINDPSGIYAGQLIKIPHTA